MVSGIARTLGTLRSAALRLDGAGSDYDLLVEAARGRSFVLLGEATHGTREFYRMRADIPRRLIEEGGFDTVAVEADWPDAYRLHRYVSGDAADTMAMEQSRELRDSGIGSCQVRLADRQLLAVDRQFVGRLCGHLAGRLGQADERGSDRRVAGRVERYSAGRRPARPGELRQPAGSIGRQRGRSRVLRHEIL